MKLQSKSSRHHFHTRFASLQDVPDLLAIEEDCFDSDRLTAANFRYMLLQAHGAIMIIEDNQQICGYCLVLLRSNSKKARIYSIAILPPWMGSGAADFLLDQTECYAKKNKCQAIFLEVRQDNLRAQGFYQRHGYVAFGCYLDYYEDGMTALRMGKELHGN